MEINKFGSLTVAVVGCGAIGKRHIHVLEEMGVGKIVACDPNLSTLELVKTTHPNLITCERYEDCFKYDPFAVFILTPTKMHIPMAITALKNGAHVFIEKPLSNSSEGIEELKAVAKKEDKQVMVGFCMRYHKALIKAKEMLKSGRVGRLVSVRAMVGEDFPSIHPEYKDMYLCKYSGVFELVHDVDLAIWFADLPVESVQSVYGSFSDYEFEAPDTVEMLMKFDGNCVASVHLDFFQNPRRRTMELICTKGIITIEFGSWDKASIKVYEKDSAKWEETEMETRRNDMFIDEDSEFLLRALDNKPMICDIDEASKSLLAVESVYKPY